MNCGAYITYNVFFYFCNSIIVHLVQREVTRKCYYLAYFSCILDVYIYICEKQDSGRIEQCGVVFQSHAGQSSLSRDVFYERSQRYDNLQLRTFPFSNPLKCRHRVVLSRNAYHCHAYHSTGSLHFPFFFFCYLMCLHVWGKFKMREFVIQ